MLHAKVCSLCGLGTVFAGNNLYENDWIADAIPAKMALMFFRMRD
jgi:hypothetical protein